MVHFTGQSTVLMEEETQVMEELDHGNALPLVFDKSLTQAMREKVTVNIERLHFALTVEEHLAEHPGDWNVMSGPRHVERL